MADRQQSPFVADKTRVPRMDAHQKHRKRSARAKKMDREFNAPLTSDQDEWAESPNRLDIVGIDTISMDNYLDRAETAAGIALDTGAVDRVEQKGTGKQLQGKFSPAGNSRYGAGDAVVRVMNTANDPETTLAHEVSHGLDYGLRKPPGERKTQMDFFGVSEAIADDDELLSEARTLSERFRGEIKSRGKKYRESPTELVADAMASGILEPRAARREAPNVFDRIEKELSEKYGAVFGRDDEPKQVIDRSKIKFR
jgi:hypothetical protein